MSTIKEHPTISGIEAAYSAIDPVFLDTPFLEHAAANDVLGCRLFAKVETLNPTRSFKGRGTDWFLENLPESHNWLVAASAGNFGQGLAYAARRRGLKLTVIAAASANTFKIDAMRRFGADVRLEGADFDAAKDAARAFATRNGCLYVEDGAECTIAEGAGTIALEITRQLTARSGSIDAILVPLGNGALLTGIGTWMKAYLPACKIIGVVAAAAPAMLLSWRAQKPVSTPTAVTIADGVAVREPVPYALECMVTTVDDVWEVSEAALRSAMHICQRYFSLVVEPAGAAGVAAVIEYASRFKGQRIATILCGGTVLPEQLSGCL
jgi:threonine dehydratase